MTSLLYLFSGVILSNYVINGKSININIDSDDVIRLMGGLMTSDIFKDFATQVFQRTMLKRYNNPFHPEDDLVAQFDDTIMKEHEKLKSAKNNSEKLDVLDKENEKFDDGGLNEEIDVLTDNELNENDKIPNILYPVMKEQQAVAVTQYKNNDTRSTTKTTANVLMPLKKKVLIRDDRFNFRPNQKRFVMQSRKDTS